MYFQVVETVSALIARVTLRVSSTEQCLMLRLTTCLCCCLNERVTRWRLTILGLVCLVCFFPCFSPSLSCFVSCRQHLVVLLGCWRGCYCYGETVGGSGRSVKPCLGCTTFFLNVYSSMCIVPKLNCFSRWVALILNSDAMIDLQFGQTRSRMHSL